MAELNEEIAKIEAKMKVASNLIDEIKVCKDKIIASCDFIYDLTQINKKLLS